MSWKDYYTAITGRSAPSEQASPSGTVYGTTPSRTSSVEDYYNEQMQQKQATDKMRQIINNERRIAEKEPAFVNPAEKKTPESGYLGWEQNEARYRANKAQEAYDTALEKYGGNDKHPSVMAAKRSLDDANMMLNVYGKAKRAYDSQPHRVQKTITGAVQNSGAGVVEAGRMLYEGGVRGATAENERQLSEYRRQLEKAQENYNTALNKYGGDQNNVNVKAAKAIVDDIQRNIDVYGNVLQDTGLQDTVDKISGVSDRLAQSSAQNIAEAKKGLGKTGRFLVDAGVGAAQLGTDALVSAVTGIPASAVMAIRTFGAGSEEARQAGASYEQQAAYGAASAAVETLTEKIFDGVAGIYGSGKADEIVEKVVAKLNTDTGRTVARSVINTVGQGAEEIISDVVNPIIRAIYNGKSIGENYSEEQISDWLYDGLVGAALGLAGSGVSIATGADAKKNAELRSRDIDNAIELMTGKKAAPEPQSAAEAQGDITTPPAPSNDAVARPVELNSDSNVETTAREQKNDTESSERLQNSPNNDKVDSTNSKVERAKDLLANGASPSQIFNETGLVVTADGKITDGFTRAKVGSYDNGQRRAADQVSGKNQVSGTFEGRVSGNDGRGVRSGFFEQSGKKTSWENISNSERDSAREIIQKRLDSVETDEADELRLSYDTDEELIRDIYKSYEDGTAVLEEWAPYFGDMNELAAELDKVLSGAAEKKGSQNANHNTGSNVSERVYVDENGNEYDPETGYTTRTAEEVQAERDAHISDDLYYTLRAEDRLTPDNAKEWAQWQRRREERQNAQKAPVPDETAWKDAEAEFGGANHDAIHKATQRAEEFETFLESDAFTSRLTDEQHTKVSDSVTEFKNKLAGLGDGHTSFAEFAEYYKAMKDSRILGDLYSERVNEQVQLARELAEEAYRNPIPYNVEKYRHAAVKAAQMTSHYIEKASKVRVELDELNNAVKENGSKRKPAELGREVERGEKGKSLREKAVAKFIRWQIMPRQMFQMIDGFKFWENGAGYRMADTIESAAVKNQMTLVEADNFFADVVKMKGYYDFATGKTKTNVRLGGKTLTMSEAVSLYKAIKTMGGPDAYRVQNIEGFALKNGDKKPYMIKADPANISGLYSSLQTAIAKNEVASAYVKAFDSMSERLGKEAQDIAKAIDGVDNELFKPGDYFPLTYARAEDVNSEWDKANSKDFGVPDFKNLKERTRTAGGYVNIAPVVEITDGYIRRAADYIAFGELADTFGIMDYMHTFGTSTLVDSMKQNMGSEYGAWMENYVKDVQDINQTRAKSRDNWWQKLNHNFQTAVLIGNPGTPFKQKGSMWLAMSELDPRAVAKAAVTSLNPGNQQMKAARDNPLLQFRAKGNIDSSITDALQDQSTLFGKMAAKSKVLEKIQNWIPAADVREVSKVYLASCYDVQMKNPDVDVNSAKFKEMVDETFQRASMRTQSQYTMNMRDEISRGDSALLKALTMFQTQQRTTANNMFTAYNEAKAAKGTEHAAKANKRYANAITGFVASNVAYAAMDVLAKGLRHKLKQFRDDDEEQQIDAGKIGLELLKSFFEGVGGTVIFGDDVTNLIESIISGEKFYENGIGAIGAIEDAASAVVNLTQNLSADNIRKAAGGLANLAGIPLNNAYTLLNSMGMYTLDVINAMNRSKESGNILNELLKGTSAADIAGKKKAGLYSISDDPADDALKIFDSIKKAVDKLPPDQFTYTDENGDEVSYELTKADKEQYRKDAEASYNSGMDALLKAFGYDKLGDKAKEDVEKQIKGYAKDAAEQGYLDSKGLDYDTGAPAWAEAVPKEDVPSYLVSKKILDADGKKTDYDAIDYLIGGFSKIPSSVQTQLKDDGVNVNALLYAKLFGIGSEAWYSNKGATKDAEESLGSSDVAKAIAVYNNMEGKSDEQILNAIKTQVLPDAGGKQSATVRRIEAYNTIAGNDADLGSWLDLAAALKDADVNGSVSKDDVYTAWANMGLSAHETYAGITRSDFYNIVKSGAKSYAVNEDYATQVDKGYASIVPAKEEADPTFSGSVRNHQADDSTAGSSIKSTSIFSMEDYYRAIGLLK